MPYNEDFAGEIILSSIPNGMARPAFAENLRAGVPDEAWINHVHKVLTKKDGELQVMPVTYSGFFSHVQSAEDDKPWVTVGIFPSSMRRPHQWPCRNTINGRAETPSMAVQKHHQWLCRNIINGRAEAPSMAMQKHHQWPCRNTIKDRAETLSMAMQKHH